MRFLTNFSIIKLVNNVIKGTYMIFLNKILMGIMAIFSIVGIIPIIAMDLDCNNSPTRLLLAKGMERMIEYQELLPVFLKSEKTLASATNVKTWFGTRANDVISSY